ncbi:MAG: MATE family efflux transporter [Sulfuricurvum sp.]|uniref:MATE family efflux transporter n=1 Tax=Sulfuricurvum sp. TaxID=2025608 RepID=UPI00260D0BA4|nr:MATE family efflux transporter [Sulfuricurvum sp.]MDD5117987.1 MATE family efflux transporter [Sulfuricurvum sp.]
MQQRVLRLAIPAALKHLLDIVQILIDMLMVGALGVAALAAVGLSMQFLMVIQALMSVYAVGSSAMISRYIGSGRRHRASSVVFIGMWVALAGSLIIGIIGWIFSADIFCWMGSSVEVIKLGSGYFGILSLGMGLIFLDNLAYNALSAAGDTRTSLAIKIFSAFLNGGLNYLFIFGHAGFDAMGVEGAAYATVCAYGFNVLLYGWLLVRKGGVLGIYPIFSFSDFKRMISIGTPAAVERVIGVTSFLLFVKMIASQGTDALAGYQIGLRIEALAFMPGFGFSVAAMVLAGQYIGARQYDYAYASGVLSTKIAMIFMGGVGVVLVVIPELMIQFFTKDPATMDQAALYLRLVGISQIPLAMTFVLSGALRGSGATKMSMQISIGSLWLFRIIPSYAVLKLGGGILGVYVAMTIETFIKGWLFWKVYQKKEWLNHKI